jgi:hypothetical protein
MFYDKSRTQKTIIAVMIMSEATGISSSLENYSGDLVGS